MVSRSALAVLAAHLVSLAAAGTTVWDGSFNTLTAAALGDWSWSNQAGPYQYYIHGKGDEYVDIAATYANPAVAKSTKGAKITLDKTAYWEGQNMRRTELIPSVKDTKSISSGKLFYHFSLKTEAANAPSAAREHQIAFFESHFTELKYGGSGAGADELHWFANSQSQWSAPLGAGVWHNFAYEIDFDAGSVGLWHSTGSDALAQAVPAVKASVSSNGADWHVGVLELAGGADTDEDFFFDGVYIESGDITTAFSGAAAGNAAAAAPSSSAAATVASSAAAAPSSAAAEETSATAAASSSTAAAVVASSSAVSDASSSSVAAAATSAAPATTLAASASKACVKRTKTVYVTQSA